MPSLRNPVGPLPSSIYWRRRLIVLLVALGVLVLLLWLLLPGGGGKKPGTGAASSSHPVTSITPGPTGSGGGSNDGTASGGGTSSGSGGGKSPTPSGGASSSAPAGTNGGTVVTVTGGTSGGSSTTGGGTGGSGGSSSGSSGGSGGSGSSTPPNASGTMNLPVCAAADVELSLTSTEQSYSSSQWPTFQLAISNTSGAACRVDLGAKSAVLTVSSDSDSHVWSSGDCPRDASSQWYAVPASATPLNAQFQWSRITSAPGCTPGGGGNGVGAGTYVARVGIAGVTVQPSHQFKLAPFGS
ncbi:hypothetical protein ABUW04_06135 [Streptacidiphilus sp. N1-10]|uniref:Uncharacterized protein n=1 Tax=Streptacidiphilus jeojiensis TaxID=3229225 RepID=A0ABV6XID4_9ACTN